MKRLSTPIRFLSLAGATAALLANASAGVPPLQTAGSLFVDVDFSSQPLGAATYVANNGTLGGGFENWGGGANDPQIAPTTLGGNTIGTPGLELDGDDFLTHVTAAGSGTLLNAPAGIVGLDRDNTIEAWVFNPSIAGEETVVSWGHRGGPDGSNMSFNYGNHGNFGAVGHWGGPDIGWVDNAFTPGAPAAGTWHHLAYTYDGTTTRVYADGALSNSEVLGAGVINTHANTPITIGSQMDNATPGAFTDGLRGTMTVGRLRIHDGVLSDAQIAVNAQVVEAGDFVDPLPPPPPVPEALPANPVNRYTFDSVARGTPAPDGTPLIDVIGGANGLVRGDGATLTGGQLRLPGGDMNTQAYGDLPNGLISTHGAANGGSGEVSIEFWATVEGGQNWSRIFDIGSTASAVPGDGEVTGPGNTNGGDNTGLDYVMWSAQIGGDTANQRIEWRNEDPAGGGIFTQDHPTATFGSELHGVLTITEGGDIVAFENGVQVSIGATPFLLSDLNDVNVWLGRSTWLNDQNMQGTFNEFRIYDYALTDLQVLGNFGAGPGVVNLIPEPTSLGLVGLAGALLMLRRRRR